MTDAIVGIRISRSESVPPDDSIELRFKTKQIDRLQIYRAITKNNVCIRKTIKLQLFGVKYVMFFVFDKF